MILSWSVCPALGEEIEPQVEKYMDIFNTNKLWLSLQ